MNILSTHILDPHEIHFRVLMYYECYHEYPVELQEHGHGQGGGVGPHKSHIQ